MSTFTAITVDDREPTPVAHTYTPNSRSPAGVFEFVERTGTPIGDSKITVSSGETSAGNFKVRVRISDPVVVNETINGVVVPKIARTAFAGLEFTFSNRSSEQERKNLIGKLANALADDQPTMMAVCRDLEGLY